MLRFEISSSEDKVPKHFSKVLIVIIIESNLLMIKEVNTTNCIAEKGTEYSSEKHIKGQRKLLFVDFFF